MLKKELVERLQKNILSEKLVKFQIDRIGDEFKKISIRPILLKKEKYFQFSFFTKTQGSFLY
jgi:hypothetical protein